MAGPNIVILGAGFAGVAVAQELARLLPREADATITLIDQNNFFLFTPMLTEVVGAEVDPGDIVVAVRRLSPRTRYVQGRIEAIDPAERNVTVQLGDGVVQQQQSIKGDHLVIALGAVTNYHGISSLREHALTIKTVADAQAIRARALALLELARAEPDSARRRQLLTFVVGGGGFSGVETMAALNGLVRAQADRYGPGSNEVRCVLVQPGNRLLPEISQGLASFAQRELERSGVEVALGHRVTAAGADWVELDPPLQGETRLSTSCLVWAGGITPSPVLHTAGLALGRHGGLVVESDGRVRGIEGVWALGDCAEFPRPGGGTYAPTAQDATREGARVGQNIAASLRGQPLLPFTYHPIGQLALVGRRSGVAALFGFHLSGALAWVLWRLIYLQKLPSWERRSRVGLNWLLDLLFGREIAALPGRASPAAKDQLEAQTGGTGEVS